MTNFLTYMTVGHSLSDLPKLVSLYVALGLCVLFLVLIIVCCTLQKEDTIGDLKVVYPQIAPDVLPQTLSKANYQMPGGTLEKSNEDIEDIIVAQPIIPSNQSQIEMQLRVAPQASSDLAHIQRTDSIKLRKAGPKFLLFHSYLTPFTKMPDSLNRPKKALLLFLRVMLIYLISGELQTLTLIQTYLLMIARFISISIVLQAIYAAISVVIASIICYLFNFFLVVPSKERIVILMRNKGSSFTEAIMTAKSRINCVKCCNVFGYVVIILVLIAIVGLSIIMPSNFVAMKSWLITFAIAIGEDIVLFQLFKIFFLLCFLQCCGGSKEKPANNCGICCNSFVAGKIVYI